MQKEEEKRENLTLDRYMTIMDVRAGFRKRASYICSNLSDTKTDVYRRERKEEIGRTIWWVSCLDLQNLAPLLAFNLFRRERNEHTKPLHISFSVL